MDSPATWMRTPWVRTPDMAQTPSSMLQKNPACTHSSSRLLRTLKMSAILKQFINGMDADRAVASEVSKELCEGRMEPHVWRASEATKLMDFGDPEPSHLPNLATLCKAKQERNDLELGDKDPILSLQMLKYSEPHSGSIKERL
ncbi:golgin subfamily A member 6-like protein 22 isoform X1 [Tachysurus ichikawai]